jgi:putative tryptophan/tyrosine transport system substrate-binding protein
MKRREFITLLGGAAAWPLAGYAQQSTMPVVGFLISAAPAGSYPESMAAVRQGIADMGHAEGQSFAIEYRWANDQYGRLPALAAELVRGQVAVMFATGSVISAMTAKAATETIPIVFANGSDPVKFGLVPSLARPGGNVTGVSFYNNALVPKRLEVLRELLPKLSTVAILVNPANPNSAQDIQDFEAAARILGLRALTGRASREEEFEPSLGKIMPSQPDALLVTNDSLFQSRTTQLVEAVARHRLPAIYASRQRTEAGGLISYGTDVHEMYRLAGTYIGRILKGEKPADLPILQPTKFELVVNLKAAKALGLTIPESFLLRADEVIE